MKMKILVLFLCFNSLVHSTEYFQGKEQTLTTEQQQELKKVHQLMAELFGEQASVNNANTRASQPKITKKNLTNDKRLAENNPVNSLPEEMKKKLLDDLLWIEGGEFKMGSNRPEAAPRETPEHTVKLDDFYIAKTEVTQVLFEQLMGWNYSYNACPTCAMNNISWFNMQLFIEKLNQATGKNFRFPTEAEWEYAAKGGQKSRDYTFSGSNNIDDVAWHLGNANNKSHKVAQKMPNELGLYDMTGNLWEFCQDDMSSKAYTKEARTNPLMGDITNMGRPAMKVLRGVGYEFSANESQFYRRDGATNNVRMPDIGFRLAMSKK